LTVIYSMDEIERLLRLSPLPREEYAPLVQVLSRINPLDREKLSALFKADITLVPVFWDNFKIKNKALQTKDDSLWRSILEMEQDMIQEATDN
jgi:hypothetical protein